MEIDLKFVRRRFEAFAPLIEAIPKDAFGSARRSTLPLIDYWREPSRRIHEVSRLIGIPLTSPVTLEFEYAVAPLRGRGKASYTDLMIIAPNAAIAVEAKYTEPRYGSVQDWLGDPSNNKREVLGGWLDCINGAAQTSLAITDVSSVPYQVIHRMASVCSLEREFRAVIYLTFGDPPRNHYTAAIKQLRDLGITSSIPVFDMNVLTKPTPELIAIEESHKKDSAELELLLRKTLAQRSLFQFAT